MYFKCFGLNSLYIVHKSICGDVIYYVPSAMMNILRVCIN